MSNEFRLPALGDGVHEVTITRWLKRAGDAVHTHEPMLEVETDKISIEVTADAPGTLLEVRAVEGAKVRVGEVLGMIGELGAAAPAAGALSPNGRHYAGRVSPVVSRMVAEHGLNLDDIVGTGEDGRITKQDVTAYLARRDAAPAAAIAPAPPAPSPPAASTDDEVQPLSPMRAKIAEHMLRSVATSPHVTTVFEFDFAAVALHREAHKAAFARDGVNLTWLAYLVHATAGGLRAHRVANSAWGERGIVLKRDVNIGIAVSIPPDGLLVPVIRNADELSLMGIARRIQDLAARARSKAIAPDELQSGTFSISNHGAGGSLFGTPIINQPQSGIIGFGAIEQRVKVVQGMIAIRPCSYISFSFDHRILDGAAADAFMADVKRRIETWT